MLPDDRRHGTYAGVQAHRKDREASCDECAKANRRYRKKIEMEVMRGQRRTVRLGEDAWRIITIATPEQLGRRGVPLSTIFRLRREGSADLLVLRRTRDAILSADVPTAIGIQRRLQALSALGWSMRAVAAEAGINHATNLCELVVKEHVPWVREPSARSIVEVYDRLLMRPAPQGRGSSRARNRAVERGWLPPLAWNDIDDPDETPTDWQYRPPTRAERVDDLDERGAGISEVMQALDITRKSLERWCVRNGRWETFVRLRDREFWKESA